MSVILDMSFPRTLDSIVADYAHAAPGSRFEFWTFDTGDDRREAERRLSAAGVDAKIRSAYKPLVHFFLEEVDIDDLAGAEVVYPVRSGCAPDRFLLEAYPLSALLPGVQLSFTPADSAAGSGGNRAAPGSLGLAYRVRLAHADGRSESREVFAPNRLYEDHSGETVLTPAGWMRLALPDGSATESPLWTEYEAIYSEAMKAVSRHEWGDSEPFFGQLSIRVSLPARDIPLSVGEEAISLREALHEDLYFSLLEYFQKRTGRPMSDRSICPGQVAPEISGGAVPTIRIETKPLSAGVQANSGCAANPGHPSWEEPAELACARHPISEERVRSELKTIEGKFFCARSCSGRLVPGVYHPGSDAGVMISGGQHANETSGVVGALRAAHELAGRKGSHFAVSPLENPDGYALHRSLCAGNPGHMHHAARYTALGNDLEYQKEDGMYEKAIRVEAEHLTGAKLHINLHGYPCHEWTRPLSGYIPRGFPTWTLPHGFFLVLRHHAAWADRATEFLDLLTLRLAEVPGLLAFTADQLELYSRYVQNPPFRLVHGFPCDRSVNETSTVPLRLITEYPDETIHGDAFMAGHTAQKETALAAYEVFQTLMARSRDPNSPMPADRSGR